MNSLLELREYILTHPIETIVGAAISWIIISLVMYLVTYWFSKRKQKEE